MPNNESVSLEEKVSEFMRDFFDQHGVMDPAIEVFVEGGVVNVKTSPAAHEFLGHCLEEVMPAVVNLALHAGLLGILIFRPNDEEE